MFLVLWLCVQGFVRRTVIIVVEGDGCFRFRIVCIMDCYCMDGTSLLGDWIWLEQLYYCYCFYAS